MLKLLLLFLALFLAKSWAQEDVIIPYKDIAFITNTNNVEVFIGAQKVYNAKHRIKFARAALLPKLNLWRVASILIDWKTAGDVLAKDLVPFLVPSNWQRLKEAKIFENIENESQHVVLNNIILHNKLMYLQIQEDQYLHAQYKSYLEFIDKIISEVEPLIGLSVSAHAWTIDLKTKRNKIKSEILSLEKLLWEERLVLSQSLGIDSDKIIKLDLIDSFLITAKEELVNINEVLEHSCEIHEYNYLLKVAPKIKKEIIWNIFGVSEGIRGVADGIFDEIPIQDGLGFGMGSSLKIHKSQMEIISKQREGVIQSVKRQFQNIKFNLDNLNIAIRNLDERLSLLNEEKDHIKMQLIMGAKVDPILQVEHEEKILLAEVTKMHQLIALKAEEEKMLRLAGREDYLINHKYKNEK